MIRSTGRTVRKAGYTDGNAVFGDGPVPMARQPSRCGRRPGRVGGGAPAAADIPVGRERVVVVRFRLLGSVEAELDGVPVDLGHAKQRGVLAVLLVEANRVVPADLLLDRLWDGRPPGRKSLHSYLSRLRAVLSATQEVRLTRRSGGYQLTVDEQAVDLHRFRHLITRARAEDDERAVRSLEQALELWRGEPLSDLDIPWANGLRASLERERLAAELDHADTALRLGRHTGLLPGLFDRAHRHPLDERAAAQLMLALCRSGRQADALAHYQHLRTRLVDQLGADPGPQLQRLHVRILAADPDLTAPGTASTPSRRLPAPPRQLPALPRLFTGRADESAELTKALDSGAGTTVVISALAGAGGIGKTWLALHWAHQHLDRFPDGQLFADLRGFSPAGRPTAAEDALRGFLGALGVAPDRVPPDLDAQTALYRSLVADRRMLVVLDNAATADQVVPLLPGSPSCAVLVTSRNRLPALPARHGARPLSLGVLSSAESRALLVATLGMERVVADERAVAELIGLCGGFPLALGLTAARIGHHLSPAEAVAELRESGLDALDADDPAASLPAVLSWSLRRLTEGQRTVFALLGIAPGPDTGLPAAACLTDLPARETRAVLRALADASLIEPRPDGRYGMHDLVRAYATTLADTLPEPVRRAALDRVVDFYLHTAHAAHRLLTPHSEPFRPEPAGPGAHPHPLPDLRSAMAWLDAEHPHLLAAQHQAHRHRRHHAGWHFAWSLTGFHRRRGHFHADLAVWRAALDAAAHLPDPTVPVHTHRRLGLAHSKLGRHEEATGHLHQALALAEDLQDTRNRAHIHHALAMAWERRGDDRKALDHARHSLDLYRVLDNPVREAVALNGVGWYTAQVGEYDAAREHCRAALAVLRRHHEPDGEAHTLDSLGYIEHHTGHHAQAVHHYQQALTLHRALGNTHNAANTLDRLAHSHTALGHHDEAREVWREALSLYREQDRDIDAERVRRQLADPTGNKPDNAR
ncbi:BTAD domain-containing putative transcriptional regulator [Actinosynnema sp. CS-041913]|uniref:AfsR/SARP family transcriptional regulator n=1 Tax=Actinosynnema sp. CS-041913 TaxID=3239917 RepID=UPI003D929594